MTTKRGALTSQGTQGNSPNKQLNDMQKKKFHACLVYEGHIDVEAKDEVQAELVALDSIHLIGLPSSSDITLKRVEIKEIAEKHT